MLFNSHLFLFLFFPICVVGYFALHRVRQHQLAGCFLLGMSLIFYAANDLRSIPVFLISMMVNYWIGRQLTKHPTKPLLVLGIVLNLLVLGVFKYLNFFLENVSLVFGQSYTPISILLPLGISFFTFQQISYLIDAHKGGAPAYSFAEYAIFASFFPYVTSGPIAFHSEIIPQMRKHTNWSPSACNLARGLTAFSFGLFKKVLIADTFGVAANWGWENVASLNGSAALVVIVSYTLQLYFDFAGYSDMASGIALCMNINLPMNFDSPYRARNISDFWKRWHITMTRFFTRYVYIPLGGSHHGLFRTCLNTLIIFLISGLWHGAAWTFILWGALHGIAMVGSRVIAARTDKHLPYPIGWFLTFVYVNFCWVFFRAPSISAGIQMLGRVFHGFGALPSALTDCFILTEFQAVGQFLPFSEEIFSTSICLLFLILALLGATIPQNMQRRLQSFTPTPALCFGSALVLFWSVISLSGVSTFLYFTF